ncbi:MAG TPA: hypothetical protein VMT76_11555 [Puia sp.]|nr:hypothetical protein [Puia sp.]
MKKRKLFKKALILIGAVFLIGAGIGLYLFFKPHRNVQDTDIFAELSTRALTSEFSANATAANAKYLSSDGNSKVLVIKGRVDNVSINQNGERVIELKDEGAKAGISATLIKSDSVAASQLKKGDIIRIKGAITAGNSYDPTLDLYTDAILVQSRILQ